jgi:hypothetical protein
MFMNTHTNVDVGAPLPSFQFKYECHGDRPLPIRYLGLFKVKIHVTDSSNGSKDSKDGKDGIRTYLPDWYGFPGTIGGYNPPLKTLKFRPDNIIDGKMERIGTWNVTMHFSPYNTTAVTFPPQPLWTVQPPIRARLINLEWADTDRTRVDATTCRHPIMKSGTLLLSRGITPVPFPADLHWGYIAADLGVSASGKAVTNESAQSQCGKMSLDAKDPSLLRNFAVDVKPGSGYQMWGVNLFVHSASFAEPIHVDLDGEKSMMCMVGPL